PQKEGQSEEQRCTSRPWIVCIPGIIPSVLSPNPCYFGDRTLNFVLREIQLQPGNQKVQQPSDGFLHGFAIGMNCDFRILGFLVRGVNPGEVLYLTRPSTFVKALRITALAHLQGGGDMDLNKLDVITKDYVSRSASIQTVRGNQRGD